MKRATQRTITATDFRHRLFSYLDAVQKGGEPLIIERNGQPQAVIFGFEQYKKAAEKQLGFGPTLGVIAELRAFHKDYLRAHGGKATSDSVAIIRQMRHES